MRQRSAETYFVGVCIEIGLLQAKILPLLVKIFYQDGRNDVEF